LNQQDLKKLLDSLSKRKISVTEALTRLKNLPFEDLGFACVDHHRGIRRGISEVIFGAGKEVPEILGIMESMLNAEENILLTRLSEKKAIEILSRFPQAVYHSKGRILTLINHPVKVIGCGTILIISAGTSDIPVAEEAAVTAEYMGNAVDTIYDIGVAGLHRVLSQRERIMQATVIVVVAGMEGALPSVVGGLVDKPVIAVPTSIGYGASFNGIAALLGMLNSCSAGITVVNIDNGFGAGYAASLINQRQHYENFY